MRVGADRVAGVGRPGVGDDAVGLEVVRRLREASSASGVEIVEVFEPSRLLSLFEGARHVVVVDGCLDEGPPGRVVVLGPEDLTAARGRLLSTHGVGVAEVIGLARALFVEGEMPRVTVVGVAIAGKPRAGEPLSPEVARAVPEAVEVVLDLLAARAPASRSVKR